MKAEALKLRSERKGISQAKLAEEIRYRLDDEGLPSPEIIVRYIRVLERAGELPKRHK